MEFFLANFKLVSSISGIDAVAIDALFDEFCDCQTMSDHEIDLKAWSEAKVVDGLVNGEVFHYRMDVLWWHINAMVVPGSSKKRSSNLVKVAELVLILPHSNTGEERLFSMIRKTKTDRRSSLQLDRTLSNLLAMKSQYPDSNSMPQVGTY